MQNAQRADAGDSYLSQSAIESNSQQLVNHSQKPDFKNKVDGDPTKQAYAPDSNSVEKSEASSKPIVEPFPRIATETAVTKPSATLPNANAEWDPAQIVFQSAKMNSIVEMTNRFAQSSASVLICGESGTGKELFAKLVHAQSKRSDKRFVKVNCAALSENLLESEFFGHIKGAYTGADQARVGRFEWANGGTILLDEVTEIPVRLQAKLLRVLEESSFQRVGCNHDQQIDVRVIATSNRDLQEAVAEKAFRDDLYHRLNVLQIEIPPLRDRSDDIPALCQRFINDCESESPSKVDSISDSAIKKLTEYQWPGNVRQLKNMIHRACVLSPSKTISPSEFEPFRIPHERLPDWLLEISLDEVERHIILANLSRFGGNKTQTAKHLGITPRTLHTKIKAYDENRCLDNLPQQANSGT